jgi:phospholipid/cholesterol/gamma-HCH transport system substrate-binding protein
MSTPTNHWKLGLFVVGGGALALALAVYLGASQLTRKHVDYVSYFDESVQGLDLGAPVKFRGVTVGRVAKIDVAPDHRHVAVTSALGSAQLADLSLTESSGPPDRLRAPPELRVQLVAQGITGLKFLQIDFFDPQQYPVPRLGFPTPEHYIPVAASTLKNVENAVVTASDMMPQLLTQLDLTLGHIDQLVTSMHGVVTQLDVKGLTTRIDYTISHANAVLSRLDGDRGLFASAQRAMDGFGDLASMSPDLGADLSDTLREIRSAASSIQRVADALERDPDMLIKGRKVAR